MKLNFSHAFQSTLLGNSITEDKSCFTSVSRGNSTRTLHPCSSGGCRWFFLFNLLLVASVLLQAQPSTLVTNTATETDKARVRLTEEFKGNLIVDAMNNKYIRARRSFLTPKTVSDAFGNRIAKRFLALQVTVTNLHAEHKWLITSAAVDFGPLLEKFAAPEKEGQAPKNNQTSGQAECSGSVQQLARYYYPQSPSRSSAETAQNEVPPKSLKLRTTLPSETVEAEGSGPTQASVDLTILRGVAEKGQVFDSRNMWMRYLRGAGTIGAGLIGVTTLGASYAPSLAAFNGPFLSAVSSAFPDMTVNQLNRLNDRAFSSNTVVPKGESYVMVLFIPQADLLTSKQQKRFYKDPESVFSCIDLRLLEAYVDGNFITAPVESATVLDVSLNANQVGSLQGQQGRVEGFAVGRNLVGSMLELENAPEGVSLKAEEASDSRISFVVTALKPLAPNTELNFTLKPPNGGPLQRRSVTLSYAAKRPALKPVAPVTVTAGETLKLELEGENFLPDVMTPVLDSSAQVTLGTLTYMSPTKIGLELTAANSAAKGPRSLRLAGPGGLSNAITIELQ